MSVQTFISKWEYIPANTYIYVLEFHYDLDTCALANQLQHNATHCNTLQHVSVAIERCDTRHYVYCNTDAEIFMEIEAEHLYFIIMACGCMCRWNTLFRRYGLWLYVSINTLVSFMCVHSDLNACVLDNLSGIIHVLCVCVCVCVCVWWLMRMFLMVGPLLPSSPL